MKVSSIFGDHMVLQRGQPIPVWGWGESGEKVRLTFSGQELRGVAGADGKWSVTLAPVKAGGPHEMIVEGHDSSTSFRDVMVGEVWVASGQSNMGWPLNLANNAQQEIAAAKYPEIRLFTVDLNAVVDAPREVKGYWSVCTPESVNYFSAVAYLFGREVHRKLGVPVGLINSSVGGTMAQAWTDRETLISMPVFREMVGDYERKLPDLANECAAYEKKLQQSEREIYPADPGNLGFGKGWANASADLSDWKSMEVPGYWQGAGLDHSGVVWFRRDVEIPAAWAGSELTLNLCPCDKQDTTYFNGVKIGETGWETPNSWDTPRSYRIPAALAKPGRNTIAVRVYSYAYAGGIMGPNAQLNVAPVGGPASSHLPLAGPWHYRVEHNLGKVTPLSLQRPLGPGNANSPYSLFNGMIKPLIPFGIRGAIWYQGESDAERTPDYHRLFAAMIEGWRREWSQGDFPFLFVQLANYFQRDAVPVESPWTRLREAQSQTLQLPNTGMAVAIDLGDATDIHPRNKQDVGKRLAMIALNQVYGCKDVPSSGPRFAGAKVEGDKIRVQFSHASSGLMAKAGPLTGFAIAGTDQRFVWADAMIDGETVLVSSKAVPKPAAVRYGWANNPDCNLYNRDGLPAAPFRWSAAAS